MNTADRKLVAIGIRCLAIIFLLVPFVFHWYVSDYDRYLHMIRGPYPFSLWGSGPRQLFGFGVGPVFFAGGLFLWSAVIERPGRMVVVGSVAITLLGFLFLSGIFF